MKNTRMKTKRKKTSRLNSRDTPGPKPFQINISIKALIFKVHHMNKDLIKIWETK